MSVNANGGKTRRFNQRKRNQWIFFTCLVALPIIQFCICYIYVNLNSFILAFQHYEYAEGALGFEITFAKFANFQEGLKLLSERLYMFKHSLILFFWTTIIGLTLALLFSYYIYKKYPLSGLFRVVLFIPKIMSGVVFVLLYRYLANDVYQYVINTMQGNSIEEGTWLYGMGFLDRPETKVGALIFFSLWVGFGVNVLMFTGTMSGIDESIVESAQLDGANTVQEFIYITFPLIWPTFVSFFVICFSGIFTDQMHLHTFFGNQSEDVATFGYYLYVKSKTSDLFSTEITYPVLSAMGLMLTSVMLPCVLTLRKVLRKYGPSVD